MQTVRLENNFSKKKGINMSHNKTHQITINLSFTNQAVKTAGLALIGIFALFRICTAEAAFPLSTIDADRALQFIMDLLASFSFLAVSAYFLSGTRLGALPKTALIAGEALLIGAKYGYLFIANLDEVRLWSMTDPVAILTVSVLVHLAYAVLLFASALPILRKKHTGWEIDQA